MKDIDFEKAYNVLVVNVDYDEIEKKFSEANLTITNEKSMRMAGAALLDYAQNLMTVFEVWDRAKDGEKIPSNAVDAAFHHSMMPRANQFFNQFELFIMPVVSACLVSWFSGRILSDQELEPEIAKAYQYHATSIFPHLIYLLYSDVRVKEEGQFYVERIARGKAIELSLAIAMSEAIR